MPKNHDIAIDPAGFRYIDDTVARLPANIALVTAATRSAALAQMFNLMATDPTKNFIVWNPPQPFTPDHYTTITRQVRKKAGFDVTINDIDPANPGTLPDRITKAFRIDGNREFRRDIHDTRTFTSAIKGRAMRVFNAAAEASFAFTNMHYQICAGGSIHGDNMGTVKDKNPMEPNIFSPGFHIDDGYSKELRILSTAQGIGTYVADIKDIEYFMKPHHNDKKLFSTNARFKNANPMIWVVKEHSVAMMRSGGTPNDKNWFPALHSSPFASPLAYAAQARILERSALILA